MPGPDPFTEVTSPEAWWNLNAPRWFLKTPALDPLRIYDGGAQDTAALVPLLGYDGPFEEIVHDLALKRLKANPKAAKTLEGLLADPGQGAAIRSWAAWALGEIQPGGSEEALLDGLKDRETGVRAFSAWTLARSGREEAVRGAAARMLDDKEDLDLRCLAALGLALQDPQHPALRRLALSREVPSRLRRSALLALGMHPGKEDLSLLNEIADGKEQDLRIAAVLGLGFSGEKREILYGILGKDPDLRVRVYAALALGIRPQAEDAPHLERCIETQKDCALRGVAAMALARTGQKDRILASAPKLLADRRHLCSASAWAALALGSARDGDLLAPLLKGMRYRQQEVVTECLKGLALAGDARTREVLLQALKNRNHPGMRSAAALAVAAVHAPEAPSLLLDLALKDPSAEVRMAALAGLGALGDASLLPALRQAPPEKDREARIFRALAVDILDPDPRRPLALQEAFKGYGAHQEGRVLGAKELSRALCTYLPEGYRLPLTP